MLNEVLKKIKDSIKNIISEYNVNDLEILIEPCKDESHGDYATNVALRVAGRINKNPKELAFEIVDKIDLKFNNLAKIEVKGPGFINLFLDYQYLSNVVFKIIKEDFNYGNLNIGNNIKVLLEFVSVNPTGSLHLGHGRGASYGDSLARIMKKAGYDVTKEHYVNDAGNQINNLVNSINERYKQLFNLEFNLTEDSYHSDEIIDIALEIKNQYQDFYLKNDYHKDFRKFGLDFFINRLKKDLENFNCQFDNWFSEQFLYDHNLVSKTLDKLNELNKTYKEDNAIWLKTSENGDDKDRVLVKSDGTYTYILPDIAYHLNKFERGFDYLINVLGADHHGYVTRLRSAIEFLGYDPLRLDIDILQMVKVIKDGEEIKMSKRSGKAITLNDLVEEVGTNALRYMYVSKSLDTHMDLDLDLALKNSNDNPVYYVLYAYARIASLFRNVLENVNEIKFVNEFKVLETSKIVKIVDCLLQYPSYIEVAATKRLPHKITHYLMMLAKQLHAFYNDEKIITSNIEEMNEKLTLLKAVQIVLKDALNLIGVKALERM